MLSFPKIQFYHKFQIFHVYILDILRINRHIDIQSGIHARINKSQFYTFLCSCSQEFLLRQVTYLNGEKRSSVTKLIVIMKNLDL